MAIIVYKPTTQSRRKMSVTDFSLLTKKSPEKKLTISHKRSFGRDENGRISVRHKGGGAKRKYRIISDLGKNFGKYAEITAVEYDPNRSAFIALIKYENNDKAYILAYEGAKIGDKIYSGEKTEINKGNRMPLKSIPAGVNIYDIELQPFQGGKLIKSAGASALLMSKDAGYALIKMPSGEVRKILDKCLASIGQVSNATHSFVRIGKAGRNRHKGIRPSVRGKAMSPNSHPHGGGEGVNSIGLKYPKTPWGKIAIGGKTRKKNKYSDRLIVKRRK